MQSSTLPDIDPGKWSSPSTQPFRGRCPVWHAVRSFPAVVALARASLSERRQSKRRETSRRFVGIPNPLQSASTKLPAMLSRSRVDVGETCASLYHFAPCCGRDQFVRRLSGAVRGSRTFKRPFSRACNTSACVGQPPSLLAETAAINFTSGCARNVRAVPRNAANDDDDGGYDGSHVTGDDELMRRQHTSISCDERLRSGFGSDSRCVCRNCSSTVAHRRRTNTCEDEQLEIDEDQLETETGKWTDASIAADVADCAKCLTELAASNRQVAALLVELFELMEDETSGSGTGIGSSDNETDDP
jgi:hypothetical protein